MKIKDQSISINMKEAFRPKYLLLMQGTNHRKSMKSLNSKTLLHHRHNSSNDFNNTQMFDHKEVQSCQSIIQSTMQRITLQNQKNHMLKTLVQMMKQQMVSIKEVSKKSEQEQFYEQSKLMKKMNYDIDKILQRHNQEIPNLCRLKEDINAKRSERVVFSNLFRKIQIQLKNAVNFYMENIIKSETSKNQQKSIEFSEALQIQQATKRDKTRRYQEQQLSSYETSQRNSHNYYSFQKVSPKKNKLKISQKQSKFITQHQDNDNSLSQRKLCHVKQQITEWQFQLNRLLKTTDCKDAQEVESFLHNVKNQNSSLEEQLQRMSSKAEELQFEHKIMRTYRKNSSIVEQSGLPKSTMRLRNVKSTKTLSTEFQPIPPTDPQSVESLLTIFGLFGQSSERFDEKVFKMDQKIDILIQSTQKNNQQSLSLSFQKTKTQSSHNQTLSSSNYKPSQNIPLNIILQKMEPVVECQKLYQKNWFLDAYQRELKKFNKKDTKKK